jgi:hypothetical protein
MTSPYDDLRGRIMDGNMTPADESFRDITLLENVAEARSNGYDRCCAECGAGITDDSDIHAGWCPEYEPVK